MQECRKIGGCLTGKAVITTAGNLIAMFVIQAVGPRYHDETRNEAALLRSAYLESLWLGLKHNLQSLAFPAISTGAYGCLLKEAARIALQTIIEYLKAHKDITLVRVVLYYHITYDTFTGELKKL